MVNLILIALLAGILLAAGYYVYRSRKRGQACIGCPSGGCCSGKCGGSCRCETQAK